VTGDGPGGARGLRGRLWWAATTVLIALSPAHHAAANVSAVSPPASTHATQQTEARGLFRKGVAELDAGRYAEALAYFQRAYALWDSPKILLNIATTLRALGENAEAASAYARYLESEEPSSSRREEVERALAEVSAELGRIVWSSHVEVARLWLDEQETTALARRELWVEPGDHLLVVERPDGSRQARRITVGAAGVENIDWAEPLPVAKPEAPPAKARVAKPVAPPSPSPSSVSKLRALARADFDLVSGGAVGAGGIAFEPHEWFRVTGGALIGMQKGAWVGLESAPIRGRLQPVLGASAPVFFVDTMYPGVSGELGLRFAATARFAVVGRAAIAHFPSVPRDYSKTLLVPSAGLEVGL
jgi:hypothetical protein